MLLFSFFTWGNTKGTFPKHIDAVFYNSFSQMQGFVSLCIDSSRLIAAKQYFMIPAIIWIIYLFSFVLPGAMWSDADDYIFSSMALKFRLILIFNKSAVCCVFLAKKSSILPNNITI